MLGLPEGYPVSYTGMQRGMEPTRLSELLGVPKSTRT